MDELSSLDILVAFVEIFVNLFAAAGESIAGVLVSIIAVFIAFVDGGLPTI